MNTTDKALLLTTAIMVAFVAMVFYCILEGAVVPDSLIFCVLGSGAAEFGLCGMIYKEKKKSLTEKKKPVRQGKK